MTNPPLPSVSAIEAQLQIVGRYLREQRGEIESAEVVERALDVLSRLTADHAQQGKEEDRLALRAHLDGVTVTSENIGDIRRSLFLPFDSAWNGLVRDETAKREGRTLDGDRDSSMAGRHVEATSLLTNVSGSEPDDSHQRIAELEAHLAQQGKALEGWRPISTARKDGTEMLLWDGFDVSVGQWLDIAGGGEWHAEALCFEEPTHWMPMPDPPLATLSTASPQQET